MSQAPADKNLLFGVLALQADLLTAEQFAEACSAWAGRKDAAVADLLVERGWLTAAERAAVELLLERKLRKHDGDVHASLLAAAGPEARLALDRLPDPELRRSLAGATPAVGGAGEDGQATGVYQPQTRSRYALNQLHARGGIGEVWLAWDGELARPVALKELAPAAAADPALRARFLEEAKITGQLEHPGVVPVYELGRRPEDGQPFYVMRFVKGRTLHDAVAAYHKARAAKRASPLELRELLNALVAVCQAAAYAHSRGVVHRDLKGRNVVLGDYGEVIVLDWGLAKVLDRPEGSAPGAWVDPGPEHTPTLHGQVMGTPSYMPPEQAAGRQDLVGPRSDVYSLGAMLYEILTGRPPFTGTDPREVIARVLAETPAPPRSLNPAAPAALQAVCLKALAREPAERYASAGELAAELKRFLADEPVTAYREPALMRAARWARRHRPLVTGMAALLAAAVVALTVGTVLLGQANARVEQERAEAQRQRDRARDAFRKARDAVDDYFTQVSEDKLLQTPLPGMQPLRKELLETALKYYRTFAEEHADDPVLQADLARAWFRVGRTTDQIGNARDAFTAYDESRKVWDRLLRDAPDGETFQAERARCLVRLGRVQAYSLGEDADGARTAEEGRDVLEALAARHADDADLLSDLARADVTLGGIADNTNRVADQLTEEKKALELWERLARMQQRFTPDLAGALMDVAYWHTCNGRAEDSLRLLDRARGLLETWTAEHTADLASRSELARAYINIGFVHECRTHDYPQALHYYDQTRQIAEKLARENPMVIDYQGQWGSAFVQMGEVYKSQGRWDKVEEVERQARDILQPLHRADPEDVLRLDALGDAAVLLADALRALHRTEGLRDVLEEARSINLQRMKAHPTDFGAEWDLIRTCSLLGAEQAAAGQSQEAAASFAQAMEVLEGMARDHRDERLTAADVASLYTELGELQRRCGRGPEARRCIERARGLLQSLHEAHPDEEYYTGYRAAACLAGGVVQIDAGEREAAKQSLREAKDLLEGMAHPPGEDLIALAEVRCQLSRLADDAAGRRAELDAAGDALRRAFAAGCVNVAEVKDGPYLLPLRQDDGFAALLAELQKEADRQSAAEDKP